jgi:RNA polymerase sigma factor (sigma-70 family)
MNMKTAASLREGASDEECMRELAEGRPQGLQPLYSRYAPLVFYMASQSLDKASAEDIVQEVFFSLWRKADRFDPRRGAFRPWLLQIAHYTILNELRARSRRPAMEPEVDDTVLQELPDPSDGPPEAAWKAYRQEAVQSAVDRLPPAQRQALSLAFFDELSHEQVAAALRLPLGTIKTRIRSALAKLRFLLAPVGVAAVALALLLGVGSRLTLQRILLSRSDRALSMVTASDITTVHVPAAAGVSDVTHGAYRGRKGTPLAVLALHNFGPAPEGKTYQAWVLHAGVWTSMGTGSPDASGNAVIVGDGPVYAELPPSVEVTVEPRGGSAAPSGPVMIYWKE